MDARLTVDDELDSVIAPGCANAYAMPYIDARLLSIDTMLARLSRPG